MTETKQHVWEVFTLNGLVEMRQKFANWESHGWEIFEIMPSRETGEFWVIVRKPSKAR